MNTALIVEDSITDRGILTQCLQQAGIKVLEACTGEDAIATLSKYHPDVIILDIVLPGQSGFEVCRALKSDANTRDIPVIICSMKGSEMDKFWSQKQGADAHLAKPIDQVELLQTVQQLLQP